MSESSVKSRFVSLHLLSVPQGGRPRYLRGIVME